MSKNSVWDVHRKLAPTMDAAGISEGMQVLARHPENGDLFMQCGCGHKFWFSERMGLNGVTTDGHMDAMCPSCHKQWDGKVTACYGLFSTVVDFENGGTLKHMCGPLCVTKADTHEEATQLLTAMMVEKHGHSSSPLGVGYGLMTMEIPKSMFSMTKRGESAMEKFTGLFDVLFERNATNPSETPDVDQAVANATGQ